MQQRRDALESEEYPGFYHVDGLDRLVVSEDARFIDLRVKYCLLPKVESWGYPAINVLGEGTLLVHRLVAKTFLACPGNSDDFEVNHIDGNKLNSHVSNLEWCTSSHNAIHAYKTGLRKDNRPVKVKDLRDGKVTEHYSLQDCARSFEVNAESVHRYINSSQIVPFKRYFTLAYRDQPWKPLTAADIGKRPSGVGVDVVAVAGKKKYLFSSMSSAARFTGVKRGALARVLGSGNDEVLNGFSFCYLNQYNGEDDFEVPVNKEKPVAPKRRPVSIVVTDMTTGQKTHWDSSEEFSNALGVKKNTLQKAVNLSGKWKHFLVKYVNR